MTWTEPVNGKWNSDKGYSLRCDPITGTWDAFSPNGPIGGGFTMIEDAQAACEDHYAGV